MMRNAGNAVRQVADADDIDADGTGADASGSDGGVQLAIGEHVIAQDEIAANHGERCQAAERGQRGFDQQQVEEDDVHPSIQK